MEGPGFGKGSVLNLQSMANLSIRGTRATQGSSYSIVTLTGRNLSQRPLPGLRYAVDRAVCCYLAGEMLA